MRRRAAIALCLAWSGWAMPPGARGQDPDGAPPAPPGHESGPEAEAGPPDGPGPAGPPPLAHVVVTATRAAAPAGRVADAVTVLTGHWPGEGESAGGTVSSGDFETRQYRGALDAAGQIPGVSFYSAGTGAARGSGTAVHTRGLTPNHTRVYLDGMPLNDPADMYGRANLAFLALDNVARFEALRGAQGVRYGSAASGGVFSLASRKGEGPPHGFVSAEGGSRGTARTRLGLAAGGPKADFSFAGSWFRTDGIGSADGWPERDGREMGNASLRLGANPAENLRFDLFAHAADAEAQFDDQAYIVGHFDGDPDLRSRYRRHMVRPQATLSLLDGRWEHKAGAGFARTDTRHYGGQTPLRPPYSPLTPPNRLESDARRIDYQTVFRPGDSHTLVAGVDWETERARRTTNWRHIDPFPTVVWSPPGVTTTGVYVEEQWAWDDTLLATAGVRHTRHPEYGGHWVWKAGAQYRAPSRTRLRAGAGTGFVSPSLFQLYDGPSANPDLRPERTFGWDIGLEQALLDGDRLLAGITYFSNKVRDGIVSGGFPGAPLANGNLSYRARGVESRLHWLPADGWRLTVQHTWTLLDERVVRRPKNTFSAHMDWKFRQKGTFTAGADFVGSRWDNNFTDGAATVRMPSRLVARAGAAWRTGPRTELFGRIENALDRKYQDVHGIGAERIGFYGGMNVSF